MPSRREESWSSLTHDALRQYDASFPAAPPAVDLDGERGAPARGDGQERLALAGTERTSNGEARQATASDSYRGPSDDDGSLAPGRPVPFSRTSDLSERESDPELRAKLQQMAADYRARSVSQRGYQGGQPQVSTTSTRSGACHILASAPWPTADVCEQAGELTLAAVASQVRSCARLSCCCYC